MAWLELRDAIQYAWVGVCLFNVNLDWLELNSRWGVCCECILHWFVVVNSSMLVGNDMYPWVREYDMYPWVREGNVSMACL